jgi:hypothetical protein
MLHRGRVACVATLGLLMAQTALVRAQAGVSLTRAGSGARAAGMADAFVAVSDDGTAASWNPAGLAQLRQPEFSLVYGVSSNVQHVSGLRSPDEKVGYSGYRLGSADDTPEFVSAAVPFTIGAKPVTFQLGWHRLYKLGTTLSADVSRQVLAGGPPTSVALDDRVAGDIDLISVAGAVKLSSRTAVGASLDFWRGEWTERLSLVERTEPTAFFSRFDHQRLRGHNVTVGLLLTYPSWNAGLVFHAPFWSRFPIRQELLSSRGPAKAAEAPFARFRLPRSVAVGLARRLGSHWTASVAVTHDEWTDALLDRIPGQPGPINFLDGLPPGLSTSRDTLALNAGVEHLVLREGAVVPVRFGFGWEPQGAMDPWTRDPIDFRLVSAGTGYNTNRFKFDAAVQYRWGAYRAGSNYSVTAAMAEEPVRDAVGLVSSQEWRVKVSAIYRIPDTEKLRGLLRRIFG